MAMLVTHMAAAVASLTWMAIEWARFRKPSLIGTVTGNNRRARDHHARIGFMSARWSHHHRNRQRWTVLRDGAGGELRLVVDDSLDVFAVHGIGGMTGTLLTAVLMAVEFGGVGYADGVTMASQFGVQATGVVTVAVWSGGISFALIKITEALWLARGQETETQGLDLTTHGETGYNVAFGGTSQ